MRYRFKALTRERLRNRRYDPVAAHAWIERVYEQSRTRRAWNTSGIALSFRLMLHENRGAPASLSIADTFRDAGFIVSADGYAGIAVAGEPCLAIAFMLMADKAGVLCRCFRNFLDDGVNARSTLRDEDRDLALQALAKTLGSIKSVGPMQRKTARKRKVADAVAR